MARRAASPPPDRGGFVLPVALVVLVLLSMIAATGLHSSRSDLRAARAAREAALALAAADAGLSRTIARWSLDVPALPAADDSVVLSWTTLPDGSAYRSVIYRVPAEAGGTSTSNVMLYTTGRVPPPGSARRTVASVVQPGINTTGLCCEAGFKVHSRLRVTGADRQDPVPEIDGTDQLPPGWPAPSCPVAPANVPGVATSDARRVNVRRGGDVDGAPPVLEDSSIDVTDFVDFGGTTYAALAAAATIAFSGNQRFRNELGPVISGGVCDTTVNTNWGSPTDPLGPCGTYFPLIHVAGNVRMQRSARGQGVLLVDGDLRLEDDAAFYGLVIVLGRLQLLDDARIFGAVMVRGGLDGGDRSDVADRAKILYSSCSVQSALANVGGATGTTGLHWFEVIP